jgi:3-oxoacyl-[acyl-carrier protein] reductase
LPESDAFASLEGKSALVTGGSRGIGRAVVLELVGAGANVTLSYRSGKEEAEEVARETGATAVQADVADPEAAKRLVDDTGELDILVNNAGVTRDGLIARMSDEDWHEVIGTNLNGVFHTCRAAVRGMMRRRSGSIVNISSVIGFTKALARELGTRAVRANVVAPGYVDTRLTQAISEDMRVLMLANTPLGRFGSPEDVAAAVRFLCSEEASFITGEVLLVDGGLGM